MDCCLRRLIKYLCVCADRPVTYLYNTLHYYERHLRERANLKRKLVHTIMSSLKVGAASQLFFFFALFPPPTFKY